MGQRLLILEDDLLLAKHLGRLFSSRGYEVRAVHSVAAFREATAREQFDALLLDLSLPDGSGLDAWDERRACQSGAGAVLMTAYGCDGVAARAAGLGIRALLAKPLDVLRLLSAVRCAAAPIG
jgi:DNA-binding response OmpR family regulator